MTTARVVPTDADPAASSDIYLDDERSIQNSQPEEFFEISINDTVTYRHTSSDRDLLLNGQLYTAIAIARSEVGVNASGNAKDISITLPIDHPAVTRYLQYGVPPRKMSALVSRKQLNSGLVEQIFVGEVTSLSWNDDNTEASFRVPARAGETALRVLPTVSCGRTCPHILYDTMCGLDRNSFKVATTIISVDGSKVRVDMGASHGVDWAQLGEFLHVASGERMMIQTQTDVGGFSTVADLMLQFPIAGMKVGDNVEIYAGCDHAITTCNAKFSNKARFGGFPQLPTRNIFASVTFGLAGSV